MSDERHKRKYPEGPRRQMTDRWKAQVRTRLEENKAADVYPRNQAELADALDVHKTAITVLFKSESSKLVDGICDILGIGPPMSERTGDDLDDFVSGLSGEDRRRALELLKLALRTSK